MHSSSLMKCFNIQRNSHLTLVRALSFVYGKNHYKTLELKKTCSDKEVRDAYIRLSKEYHPDRNPNTQTSEKRFVEINEAYSVLSRPATRRRYDDYLGNWDTGDQQFSSSYEELTHRFNQYHANKQKWKVQKDRSENTLPLHRVLFFVIGAMFFIGTIEFQIVKKVVQGPNEIIDGVPIYHSHFVGPDLSRMNEEQIDHYNSTKRRIIQDTVRSMKAENDLRKREQDRLRTIMENGAQRQKAED